MFSIPLPSLRMWGRLVGSIRKDGRWISPEFNWFPSRTRSLQNTAAFSAAFCLLFFQQPCLPLACFSIFSSSSSDSYVDTTQCWSQLLDRALLLHLGTKRGYFHACHVDTKIPFTSVSSKSAIQCQEVQLVPVHFQLCPGGHQLELMKTRRFFPKCPP